MISGLWLDNPSKWVKAKYHSIISFEGMKKRAISAALVAGIVIVIIIAVAAAAYLSISPSPEEEKPMKVAAIYTTPLEEPWNSVLHEAMLNAQEELGIEYLYVENVAQSDFERVARDYIDEGAEIIFAHSYNFYQDTIRLAEEFPDICFVQGSGPLEAEWPSNVILYDYWLQDAAFLAGATAGLLTKSGKIGVVAAIPVTDVNNLVNAFIAGAKHVNSDVQPSVVFIQSWFDPEAAKNAASAMIDDGVDFIYAERYGVFEACEEAQAEGKEVYAFGNIVDQNSLSPDVVLASVAWDMKDFVKSIIQDKMAGKCEGKIITNFPGWSKLIWNEQLRDEVVPSDVLGQIQALEQKIRSGELVVEVDTEWNPEKWGI